MRKMVIYNGNTQSYYGCSSPESLVIGRIYEVTGQSDRGWQTDYTLQGVSGYFNSCWFDELTLKPTYYAISDIEPKKGEPCSCTRYTSTKDSFECCTTTPALSVDPIGLDTYRVITQNSIYIVSVM